MLIAKGHACFRGGEIRILDSNGAVERVIPFKQHHWELPHAKAIIDAADKPNFTERPRIALLLHQPDLLTYFQTRLQAMSEFNLPIVHQIQDALVEVKPLINIGNARISAESVKKVNEITTRLGNDIIEKD